MGWLQFPSVMHFKTIDTSEKVDVASFTLATDNQIKYGRIMLYINGISVTTEQIRLNVNPSETNANPIFSSDWADLADITTHTGDNWIGWVRLDFNEEHLDSDVTYTIQLETNNYTRNADTAYLGISFDWPYYINDQADESKPSYGVELYGLE